MPEPGTGQGIDVPAARVFEDLLAASHTVSPAGLADLLREHAAGIGVRSLVVYLVDVEQRELIPVPARDTASGAVLRVEGTLAGRAFATIRIQESHPEDGTRRLWIPLLDGTERLGVIEVVIGVPE